MDAGLVGEGDFEALGQRDRAGGQVFRQEFGGVDLLGFRLKDQGQNGLKRQEVGQNPISGVAHGDGPLETEGKQPQPCRWFLSPR